MDDLDSQTHRQQAVSTSGTKNVVLLHPSFPLANKRPTPDGPVEFEWETWDDRAAKKAKTRTTSPLSLASDLIPDERAKNSFQSSSSVTVAVPSRITALTGSADIHNMPYATNAAKILLQLEPDVRPKLEARYPLLVVEDNRQQQVRDSKRLRWDYAKVPPGYRRAMRSEHKPAERPFYSAANRKVLQGFPKHPETLLFHYEGQSPATAISLCTSTLAPKAMRLSKDNPKLAAVTRETMKNLKSLVEQTPRGCLPLTISGSIRLAYDMAWHAIVLPTQNLPDKFDIEIKQIERKRDSHQHSTYEVSTTCLDSGAVICIRLRTDNELYDDYQPGDPGGLAEIRMPPAYTTLMNDPNSTSTQKAKHTKALNCLRYWTSVLLQYRCDTVLCREKLYELLAESTIGDSFQRGNRRGSTQILQIITDDSNPLSRKRYIRVPNRFYRGGPDDEIALNAPVELQADALRHIEVPPNLPESYERKFCRKATQVFFIGGSIWGALEWTIRAFTLLEGQAIQDRGEDLGLEDEQGMSRCMHQRDERGGAKRHVEDCCRPLEKDCTEVLPGPFAAGCRSCVNKSKWTRATHIPPSLWSHCYRAAVSDSMDAEAAANTLSNANPTQMAEQLTNQSLTKDSFYCRLKRGLVQFASNRGLRPSLDASDLIAVENPNCPSEKRHHHAPDNINLVPSIWNITKWTFLLATQTLMALSCAIYLGARQIQPTHQPLDLKLLETRPDDAAGARADTYKWNDSVLKALCPAWYSAENGPRSAGATGTELAADCTDALKQCTRSRRQRETAAPVATTHTDAVVQRQKLNIKLIAHFEALSGDCKPGTQQSIKSAHLSNCTYFRSTSES